MSCCREIQYVESCWTNDLLGAGNGTTGDEFGLGGFMPSLRIPGYVDDYIVFVGGYTNQNFVVEGINVINYYFRDEVAIWANKETFAFEYILIRSRHAYTAAGCPFDAADGSELEDPEDAWTDWFILFHLEESEPEEEESEPTFEWVVVDQKESGTVSFDTLRPLGVSYINPVGRQWYPDGDETTMPITYEQASNPETQITVVFHGEPQRDDGGDPWTEEITYTFSDQESRRIGSSNINTGTGFTTVAVEVFTFEAPANEDGYSPSFIEVAFSHCQNGDTNPLLLRVVTFAGSLGIAGNTNTIAACSARWMFGEWTPVLYESQFGSTPAGSTLLSFVETPLHRNDSSLLVPDHFINEDDVLDANLILISDFVVE